MARILITDDIAKLTGEKLQIDGKPFNVPAIRTGVTERTKIVYLDQLSVFDKDGNSLIFSSVNPNSIITMIRIANWNDTITAISYTFSLFAYEAELGYVKLINTTNEFANKNLTKGMLAIHNFQQLSAFTDTGQIFTLKEYFSRAILDVTHARSIDQAVHPLKKYINDATWYIGITITKVPTNPEAIVKPLAVKMDWIDNIETNEISSEM